MDYFGWVGVGKGVWGIILGGWRSVGMGGATFWVGGYNCGWVGVGAGE